MRGVESWRLRVEGVGKKRHRRCALPAQSKASRLLERQCSQQSCWWSAPASWSAAGSDSSFPEKSLAEHLSKIGLRLGLIAPPLGMCSLRGIALGSASRWLLGALPCVPR